MELQTVEALKADTAGMQIILDKKYLNATGGLDGVSHINQ